MELQKAQAWSIQIWQLHWAIYLLMQPFIISFKWCLKQYKDNIQCSFMWWWHKYKWYGFYIFNKKVNHTEIKKYSDSKLKNFNKAVHDVLLNLAKQVVSDGEGASKFISINCINCRTEKDAKIYLLK